MVGLVIWAGCGDGGKEGRLLPVPDRDRYRTPDRCLPLTPTSVGLSRISEHLRGGLRKCINKENDRVTLDLIH